MVEVYSSKILRRKWQAVTDFILAAEAFRDDRENEELRQNVAEAAGRADGAAKMTGMITVHTDPPVVGGRSTAYDAIAAWDSTIDPFTDQLLVAIDVAYQVRGRLESMADDAEREERSLVGWVARLVGFPGRVRRHLADRGYSSATQSAGFAVSIVVQVLAALATGLAVTWIVSQLGW